MDTSTPRAPVTTPALAAPIPAPPRTPLVAPPVPNLLQQQALPKPVTNVLPAKPAPAPKHFLAAFFLSFFLGIFGADRFYLGYTGQGVLKLLTMGWFGIGAMIDLGIIMGGGMRTAKGDALVGYDEYKGLAKKTIGWLTIGGVVVVVVIGIAVIASFSFLASTGLLNTINSGLNAESGGAVSLPGFSQSQGTQQYESLLKQLQ